MAEEPPQPRNAPGLHSKTIRPASRHKNCAETEPIASHQAFLHKLGCGVGRFHMFSYYRGESRSRVEHCGASLYVSTSGRQKADLCARVGPICTCMCACPSLHAPTHIHADRCLDMQIYVYTYTHIRTIRCVDSFGVRSSSLMVGQKSHFQSLQEFHGLPLGGSAGVFHELYF